MDKEQLQAAIKGHSNELTKLSAEYHQGGATDIALASRMSRKADLVRSLQKELRDLGSMPEEACPGGACSI